MTTLTESEPASTDRMLAKNDGHVRGSATNANASSDGSGISAPYWIFKIRLPRCASAVGRQIDQRRGPDRSLVVHRRRRAGGV
jgi:hypothetical protein